MTSPGELLPAFISWASVRQQKLIELCSPYVGTLQVGPATDNRAVTLTIEMFKVEPTGWIGNELVQGGTLTVWENGCADAVWAQPSDLEVEPFAPSYQEHWHDLDPQQMTAAFERFTINFEVC